MVTRTYQMPTDEVTLISKDSRGLYNDIIVLTGPRFKIEPLCNNFNQIAKNEGSYFSFTIED
jgi:hypothetical protein